MPSDDIIKSPDFDESAKPGMKRQLVKLIVWWDLKHYRRYLKTTVGFPTPADYFFCFPVAVGHEQAILQDPFTLEREQFFKAMTMAKKGKYFAEVKWADKDPDINKWESELLVAIGHGALVDDNQKLVCNIIQVPDRVKGKFLYD